MGILRVISKGVFLREYLSSIKGSYNIVGVYVGIFPNFFWRGLCVFCCPFFYSLLFLSGGGNIYIIFPHYCKLSSIYISVGVKLKECSSFKGILGGGYY